MNDVELPPRRRPASVAAKDVFLHGAMDDVFQSLAIELGWAEELSLLLRGSGVHN